MTTLFGFGVGEGGAGGFYQGGEVVAVVDILDVEIGLRAVVGRTQDLVAEQFTAGLGGFHVKCVVADEAKDFAVTVNTIIAKHLAGHDVARSRTLVGDKLYKIRIA